MAKIRKNTPDKKCRSCISCMIYYKDQFFYCYPLLGQDPPHKDRFKHRSELQQVAN